MFALNSSGGSFCWLPSIWLCRICLLPSIQLGEKCRNVHASNLAAVLDKDCEDSILNVFLQFIAVTCIGASNNCIVRLLLFKHSSVVLWSNCLFSTYCTSTKQQLYTHYRTNEVEEAVVKNLAMYPAIAPAPASRWRSSGHVFACLQIICIRGIVSLWSTSHCCRNHKQKYRITAKQCTYRCDVNVLKAGCKAIDHWGVLSYTVMRSAYQRNERLAYVLV